MAQNFIVGHEVMPANVQDASLAGIQSFPIGLYEGPGLAGIK